MGLLSRARDVVQKAHFHWQNLVERTGPDGELLGYGWPIHGRCWLKPFGRGENEATTVVVGFEWNLWQRSHVGISLRFDKDRDNHTTLGIGLPPVSLFFYESNAIPVERLPAGSREAGVRLIDDTIVVDLWNDPWCWSKDDQYLFDTVRLKIPRSFTINVLDLLLGKLVRGDQIVRRAEIDVQMPEGAYPALAELVEAAEKRPRWPVVKREMFVDVKLLKGVPVPGKGESAWDCEDGAIMETRVPATTIPAGVAEAVKRILRERVKHGGKNWKPSPVAATAPGTEEDLPDPPGSDLLGTDDQD